MRVCGIRAPIGGFQSAGESLSAAPEPALCPAFPRGATESPRQGAGGGASRPPVPWPPAGCLQPAATWELSFPDFRISTLTVHPASSLVFIIDSPWLFHSSSMLF